MAIRRCERSSTTSALPGDDGDAEFVAVVVVAAVAVVVVVVDDGVRDIGPLSRPLKV